MTLDQFGKIAAAEIAFYIPVLCIAFVITLRNGFGPKQGWIYLFLFSLIRVIGAALTIAYKTQSNPQTGLIIAAVVLSSFGLSPLMLTTNTFVTKIATYVWRLNSRPLHIVRLLLIVAPILAAVGASEITPGNSQSTINTGRTLTRVGLVLYMVAFVAIFAIHLLLWREKLLIPDQHLKLLFGISLAMPPLFIRLVYSLLSAFSNSLQSRFSIINGDWRIYLGMGLTMEYLVVVAYVAAGFLTSSDKEEEEEIDMNVRGTGYA